MKNILNPIAEAIIGYDASNADYFQTVFGSSDYLWIGLSIILIPLLCLLIYYKVIDPILAKVWHWLLAILVSAILVWLSSYFILVNNSLELDVTQYTPGGYAPLIDPQIFALMLAALMGCLSLIISTLLYTYFLRFTSTNNRKNPY